MLRLMSEAIPEALGARKADVPLAYLSGPSFAKEMIAKNPMSVVVASEDIEVAKLVQSVVSSDSFRIYVTDDGNSTKPDLFSALFVRLKPNSCLP